MPNSEFSKSEEEPLIPDSPTLKPFWDAVQTGEFKKPSHEEIEKTVDEVYFRYQPLTELSADQEKCLKEGLVKKLVEFNDIEAHPLMRVAAADIALIPYEDVRPEWKDVF